jgi:hypothetical protein
MQGLAAEMETRRSKREMANIAADKEDCVEIQRSFWRNVSINPAVYGADTPGSLFPKTVKHWNLNNLPGVVNTELLGGTFHLNSTNFFDGPFECVHNL